MCKHGDMFSLAVLIGRGLDHIFWKSEYELQVGKKIDFYSVLRVQNTKRYGSAEEKRTISSVGRAPDS